MAFPSESELKKIRKKLARGPASIMVAPNPTALQQLRWDICQRFVIYRQAHRITLDEMARLIGTDKGKLSKILHHRIESFSTDRLVTFLLALEPKTKLKIA